MDFNQKKIVDSPFMIVMFYKVAWNTYLANKW